MQIRKHRLLSPVIGTSREIVSFHFGPTDRNRKIYIQAALHADEVPGLLVAHHLKCLLAELEECRSLEAEVVLVPVANPIGLSQWIDHAHIGRFELLTAENFNRHYPDVVDIVAKNVETKLGSDETTNVNLIRAALVDAIRALPVKTEMASLRQTLFALAADADVVLDLHCDSEALMHLYAGSPLWDRVEPLARYLGAAAALLETVSGDHPFDEACSRTWWMLRERFPGVPIPLACVSVTVELRGEADVSKVLAEQDAGAIISYLTGQGFIRGSVPLAPPLLHDATPLAGSEAVESPVSGVVDYQRELGDMIHTGDLVANVIDPITGHTTALKATTDGVLYARSNSRFAHTGMRLCKIAGKVPFRTGNLLSAR
jgi:predicted deacylase